jgi:hypothetical protein
MTNVLLRNDSPVDLGSEERLVDLMCRAIVNKSISQKWSMITITREYLQERGLDAEGVKEVVDALTPLTNTDTIAQTFNEGAGFFDAIKKHGVLTEIAELIGATNIA